MSKEQAELERHLSESLFVINAGVNDYGQINNKILPSTRSFALFLLKRTFQTHIWSKKVFGEQYSSTRVLSINRCTHDTKRKLQRFPGVLNQFQSQLPGFIFVHSDINGFLVEMRTTLQGYRIHGSLAALIALMMIPGAVATLFAVKTETLTFTSMIIQVRSQMAYMQDAASMRPQFAGL